MPSFESELSFTVGFHTRAKVAFIWVTTELQVFLATRKDKVFMIELLSVTF